MGGLLCAAFPGASFLSWDSNNSWTLDICLHWIPISSINGLNRGLRSKVEVSGDQARLKTLNSSSESGTSITSSSSVLARREEVATPMACDSGKTNLDMPSGMGSVVSVPSGIGPESKKPGAATLICCSRRSLALMTHLGTKKLLEIGT